MTYSALVDLLRRMAQSLALSLAIPAAALYAWQVGMLTLAAVILTAGIVAAYGINSTDPTPR